VEEDMRPSEYAKKHSKNQKELIEVLSRVVDYVGLLPEIKWVVECKEKERMCQKYRLREQLEAME
jgi:hypothetical protein